jgi:hypothetical protein
MLAKPIYREAWREGLTVEDEGLVKSGMSGSPILSANGHAMALMSADGFCPVLTDCAERRAGPQSSIGCRLFMDEAVASVPATAAVLPGLSLWPSAHPFGRRGAPEFL